MMQWLHRLGERLNAWHTKQECQRKELLIREYRVLAVPTLLAMGQGGPNDDDPPYLTYYGRSVERLWLDGGSAKGFVWLTRLGWAEWSQPRRNAAGYCDRERLGRLTEAGKTEYRRIRAEREAAGTWQKPRIAA